MTASNIRRSTGVYMACTQAAEAAEVLGSDPGDQ